MKYLIMCEGPNELEVISILLRNSCLRISIDDLLGLKPYHARQIKNSGIVQNELNMYSGLVKIIRIGDSLNEKLIIPMMYKDKIIEVTKYCTKPELEMLLIIAEKKIKEYDKVKSKMKPKIFAKQNIMCGRNYYKNDSKFYTEYFEDIDLLVDSIKEYKRIKGTHKKDELYLADLLR
ncbi:MAG: GNAT family acetyltransferase [Lachnospiraceae bacterium]|nr:GNAT family acetyltransferase [Lachnospiraceae bacterium]